MRTRFSKRLMLALALALIGAVGPGASAASASTPLPTSYCATGFCTEVVGTNAKDIWLELGTFNYTAGYQVCVDPPRGKTRCRTLYLTRGSLALYHADIFWADKFPHRGRGIYRVVWKQDGTQLGPTLGFKLG